MLLKKQSLGGRRKHLSVLKKLKSEGRVRTELEIWGSTENMEIIR